MDRVERDGALHLDSIAEEIRAAMAVHGASDGVVNAPRLVATEFRIGVGPAAAGVTWSHDEADKAALMAEARREFVGRPPMATFLPPRKPDNAMAAGYGIVPAPADFDEIRLEEIEAMRRAYAGVYS